MAVTPRNSDADLGSIEFWGRPAERDRYFEHLRRRRRSPVMSRPRTSSGLPDQGRMHYWAIVRYEDIRRISRDPVTFCSGDGVQFADAPPEMLEASQSFLAMDAPRHSKLRGLVSRRSRHARWRGSRRDPRQRQADHRRRRRRPAAATSST